MTVEEARQEFQKLAQDAGLDPKQAEVVLQAMENEKFRSGIAQGYKRQSEFSRGLDDLAKERERLKTWYEKEELPRYQRYTQVVGEYDRYKETFGELEDDPQGLNNGGGNNNGQHRRGGNGNGNSAGYSKEELDRMFEEKLKQRDAAYVGLTKTAVKISSDYARRFGDTLDVDEVEKIALSKGLPLDQAYKEYIAPKEQAAMEARHKDEIEKAKAEAVRDYQSRNHLPTDTKPREAHPFWDRQEPAKDSTPLDQDRTSREEFMKGWNNYEAEQTQKTAG